MYYIHKYEESQQYGGPEEGGWWYDLRTPVSDPEWAPLACNSEDGAYDLCRLFNQQETKRRESLRYGYTSVLSSREEFFTFEVSDSVVPDLPVRPHYE